jgi:hypothetical protein
VRDAGHDLGDRLTLVGVAFVLVLEERVQALDALASGAHGLQAERHAVVGEGEAGVAFRR